MVVILMGQPGLRSGGALRLQWSSALPTHEPTPLPPAHPRATGDGGERVFCTYINPPAFDLSEGRRGALACDRAAKDIHAHYLDYCRRLIK